MQAGEPIEMKKGGLGVVYQQDGQTLDRAHMVKQLKHEPSSAKDIRAYTSWTAATTITSLAGGALIGWPVGQAIAGDPEPLWVLAAAGGGLIVVAIPMAVVGDKKLKKGVRAYNEGLRTTGNDIDPQLLQLNLTPTPGGSVVGLKGSF